MKIKVTFIESGNNEVEVKRLDDGSLHNIGGRSIPF